MAFARNACFVLVLLIGGLATEAQAQEFPLPGKKNPDWVVQELPSEPGMPTMRVYDVPDATAPPPSVTKKNGQYNAETGELLGFYDRRHGIFYDVKNGVLYDRTTGKHYRFYRRGAQPKPDSRTRFL